MPSKRSRTGDEGTSALEWAAGLLGTIIALGMLAFLGVEAIRGGAGEPPAIEVRTQSVTSGPGGHVVEVEVVNRSPETAAAVAIEGELKRGDSVVESSSATLAYVPGNSSREAGLIFSEDPQRFSLAVRAVGYERP